MASMREKLRQANQNNAANRGSTSTDDTVFGDFINRPIEEKEESVIAVEKGGVSAEVIVVENDSHKEVAESVVDAFNDNEEEVKSEIKKDEIVSAPVSISLLLNPDVYEYLIYKAFSLGIPIKDCFRMIVKNEMESACPEISKDDELAKKYRIVQHNTVRKTIIIDEQFRDEIKTYARYNRMKYTSYMGYCIDRARLNDKEYNK